MLPFFLDCFCFGYHRLVYPMLPVSLDCPLFCLSSSCVPYVTGFSGLSIVLLVIFLCTLCYQFLWIAFVLLLIVLCTLCYQFLWIVHCFASHCFVYPMLPVSLDFPLFCLSSFCVPYVTSFSGLPLFCLSSLCVPYATSFSGMHIVLLVIVLCNLCYQFLWIVHSFACQRHVDTMLPVSLDCFCFACLRLLNPMLPVTMDCPLFCL